MNHLSERLNFLLNTALKYNGHFYDLCCDHGQLGIKAYESNHFIHSYLIDVVPSIINKLKDICSDIPESELSILLKDCTKLEFSNKLSKIIVIAGIGGKLSIRILENIMPQLTHDDIIILSPHNNLEEVRCYLSQNKYYCEDEHLIRERQKFYEVLEIRKQAKVESNIGLVGKFESSDKEVKLSYFKKNIDYYKVKLRFNKEHKTNEELLSLYQERLKSYE